MKSRNHITAFYVEALLLILVFVGIILVLTHVFGAGLSESSEARILTDSVTLAQSSAEAVAASDTREELEDILSDNGEALLETGEDGSLELLYDEDLIPLGDEGRGKDKTYRVVISWEDSSDEEAMISSTIRVFYGEAEEPAYTLETAKYRKGDAA